MTATRIAVGESDPSLRYVLAAALVAAGHQVVDVEDGVALLELFGETTWTPDAVVADADLPRLSGLDVLAELRDAEPPVPVILLATPPVRELRLQARRLGAFAVIDKPVSPELLVEVARRATRGPYVVTRQVALSRAADDDEGPGGLDLGRFDPRGAG